MMTRIRFRGRALLLVAVLVGCLLAPATVFAAGGGGGGGAGGPMTNIERYEAAKEYESACADAVGFTIPVDNVGKPTPERIAAEARLKDAQAASKAAYAAFSDAEKKQFFSEQTSVSGMSGMVRNIIAILFGLASSLAVINVVWQGFKLMGANPNSAQEAKAAIIKSFLGLATILFAWSIVGFVVNLVAGI
jgi:Type IV secretion system pilin